MTTLYATDLDGTLLDADAKLSPTTAKILNQLSDEGVLWSIVTARTPATVEPILSQAQPSIPCVVMTGAALWDAGARQYDTVAYHRPQDALDILDICISHGVVPFVYTLPCGSNSIIVYHQAEVLTPIEDKFVCERTLNDLKTFNLHTVAPKGFERDTVLFFAMGDPQRIRQVAEAIRSRTSCYASWYPDTYNPNLSLLEVFTEGVSKAQGLLDLKARVGADRVVAFGDNLNDIPMLRVADVAVAVENAHPDVKAAADIVIGANTTDAVARFMAERK